MLSYFIFIYDYIIIYIMSFMRLLIKNRNTKNNIYISLTTIPSRSKNILYTVNSILNQKINPQKIFITISTKNLREENINYQLPDVINNHPLIEIITSEKDNGPINKLYGGILKCKNDNDIIITVDDDSIYNRNMIKNIYEQSKIYKEQVIGTIGRIKYNKKIFGYNQKIPCKVKLLEGYGGVGYRKKFFNIQDINTSGLEKEVIFNDDIHISYILKNKGIDLIMVPSEIKEPITYTIFTEKTNPLWKQNENNGLFNRCIKTLKLE